MSNYLEGDNNLVNPNGNKYDFWGYMHPSGNYVGGGNALNYNRIRIDVSKSCTKGQLVGAKFNKSAYNVMLKLETGGNVNGDYCLEG